MRAKWRKKRVRRLKRKRRKTRARRYVPIQPRFYPPFPVASMLKDVCSTASKHTPTRSTLPHLQLVTKSPHTLPTVSKLRNLSHVPTCMITQIRRHERVWRGVCRGRIAGWIGSKPIFFVEQAMGVLAYGSCSSIERPLEGTVERSTAIYF